MINTPTINAPRNIPYFYNRASNAEKDKLNKTFDHFNIQKDQTLVGEVILRLEKFIEGGSYTLLPTDIPGKTLFNMYRFYYKQT